MRPYVASRDVAFESPWLKVVVKEVELGPPRGRETFWSVRTGTYCVILATTEGDGLIPLVRQYRPAVEDYVLELPSGGIEDGEKPEDAARRELLEEAGCTIGDLSLLGTLHTDSGRMETTQWVFFAPGVKRVAEPVGDEQLDLRFVEPRELMHLIETGEFKMAVHLGVICRALVAGSLSL